MRTSWRLRLTELVDEIGIRFSHRIIVDGLWIGSLEREHIELIRVALSLIKECDPIKYNRILHDIRKIWMVADAGSMGSYRHNKKMIILNSIELKGLDPKIVSLVIIHEATHARLMRFGYDEAIRYRIEQCCIRREIAFARRYPDGEDIAQWASDCLLLSKDAWSNTALQTMAQEGAIKALRELSVPKWITRILLDKQAKNLRG